MTTSTAEDFYSGIGNALTPEQAAQALTFAELGDTGTSSDNSGAPAPTPAPATSGTPEATPAPSPGQSGSTPAAALPEDKQNAENTVILAKDGKHTIGFDQLEKARQQRDEFKAQAEASQRALADLQAQAQARADAGQAPTKTDNMVATAEAAIEAGADAGLFGDFSEEALTKGIQHLVQKQVQAHVAQAMQPMQAKQHQAEQSEHERAIYTAHPNADSIVQSEQFKAWIESHPSTVRNALWMTFDPQKGGTAAEVVEVLDAYSKANPPKSDAATTTTADTKATAQAAVLAAQANVPHSLSSIPGGHADGRTTNERIAAMSGIDQFAALEGKTPAQIEAFLNQQL